MKNATYKASAFLTHVEILRDGQWVVDTAGYADDVVRADKEAKKHGGRVVIVPNPEYTK